MNIKPKVLMYGWEFPPYISGGLGMACYGIVSGLAKQGIKVSLILPKTFAGIDQNEQVTILACNLADKVPLNNYLAEFTKQIDIHKIEALLHPYLNENSYQLALIKAAKLLKQNSKTVVEDIQPFTGEYGQNLIAEVLRYAILAGSMSATVSCDVIHAHDWLTVLAGIVAKQITGKPLVFQIHALEIDRSGENVNREIFLIEKHGMKEADKVIAVSEYTKNMIIKYYEIPVEKIEVVHNGIFAPEPKEMISQKIRKKTKFKMVLFVGRITHQKGPWFFIQVAKKILEKRKDVHFVMAGSGDQLKSMIKNAAAARIGAKIHFMGFLSQKMVKKLYQLADVYIMPSVSEPFGLSCLEALTHNIPVVISKQSGVSEVLRYVLKSDYNDINDMAAKTLSLLDYKALSEQMMKDSAKDIAELTWDKTASNIINIYNHLINYE